MQHKLPFFDKYHFVKNPLDVGYEMRGEQDGAVFLIELHQRVKNLGPGNGVNPTDRLIHNI
ncbi:hypothetical protein D3C85_1770640 [compost metagenome]